jgi:hypothetical protein
MPMHARERWLQEQREHHLRYGLEEDPRDEREDEFELADRIADQASLPAGDPGCRAIARTLLGHDDRPPRPPIPEPPWPAGGANGAAGGQPGRGPRLPDMPGRTSARPGRRSTTGSNELAPDTTR